MHKLHCHQKHKKMCCDASIYKSQRAIVAAAEDNKRRRVN